MHPRRCKTLNILILSSFVDYGGDLPLGCGMLWQLWCQSPESGYAQCTLPSSHTVNRWGWKGREEIFEIFKEVIGWGQLEVSRPTLQTQGRS